MLQLIDSRPREPLLTFTERAALHDAPWLVALPPEARLDVLRHCRVRSFRGGERVSLGAAFPALYGLASGAVGIRLPGGTSEVVECLAPGTWFADAGPLVRGQASFVAEAHRRATVMCMPAASLQELVRRHSCLHDPVLALSTGLSARLLGILDDLATSSVRTKLARCLLRLGDAFGEPEHGGVRVMLSINQSELACLVRASRQRLNLELKRLEAGGAVRLEKEIVLADVPALKTAAAAADDWNAAAARPLRGAGGRRGHPAAGSEAR
jgi:CRP/FNR family cyclic AMP-dependent transcriptional regulator